jgi:hypothetical protein
MTSSRLKRKPWFENRNDPSIGGSSPPYEVIVLPRIGGAAHSGGCRDRPSVVVTGRRRDAGVRLATNAII